MTFGCPANRSICSLVGFFLANLAHSLATFSASFWSTDFLNLTGLFRALMARPGLVDLENGKPADASAAANAADGNMTRVSENGYIKQRTLADVAAEDPQRMALVRNVLGQCRTLGVDFDPSARISVPALDMQLRGKDVTARLKLKQSLSLLGLIP
jgi:hypothetical protein